jgi:hypothetical protein
MMLRAEARLALAMDRIESLHRVGVLMHALPLSVAVAATLLTALPASASDSLCPDAVSVKQTGVSPAPEWSMSYSTTPSGLEMVTFYSGPPQDKASLVYDDLVGAKDSSTATWTFPKDARGYWVKCSYRGTTLELSKALPPTLSSCRVTYDRQGVAPSGLPAIKRITCQ